MSAIDPAATPDPGNSAAGANEAAQVDWDSPDNPYVTRFRDTQAAYTQGQQRLRELETYESDPSAYIELGRRQGWIEVEEPAPTPGVDPRLAQTQQELAEMRQWREQVEADRQAERAAAGEELFHQDLDQWAGQEGVQLSPADHNAIFGLLMRSPDPTQESAARAIFDAHIAAKKADQQAAQETWQREYEEQRRRPRAPHVPGGGTAETGVPDFSGMNRTEVNQYMAEQVRAARQ